MSVFLDTICFLESAELLRSSFSDAPYVKIAHRLILYFIPTSVPRADHTPRNLSHVPRPTGLGLSLASCVRSVDMLGLRVRHIARVWYFV